MKHPFILRTLVFLAVVVIFFGIYFLILKKNDSPPYTQVFDKSAVTPGAIFELVQVSDIQRKLLSKEKTELIHFIRALSLKMQSDYNQDTPLSSSTPLYQLIRTNWPQVKRIEIEGGKIVFLGELADFLDSSEINNSGR